MTVRHKFSPRFAVGLDCSVGIVITEDLEIREVHDFPTMCKPSFKKECDINEIMRKFVKTGALTHVNRFGGHYADVEPTSFHEAMNVVKKGEEMFDALPAVLRRRFRNSPEEFLAYVQDPKNLGEMRELGLALPEVVKPPTIAQELAEVLAKGPTGGPGAKPPAPGPGAGTVVT